MAKRVLQMTPNHLPTSDLSTSAVVESSPKGSIEPCDLLWELTFNFSNASLHLLVLL